MIVNAFKQLLNRKDREKNFSWVSRKWVHSKRIMLYSEWKSTKSTRLWVVTRK